VGAFPSPPDIVGKEWRCDTHPSASRSGRQFCFDSAHNGGRQVYVADIAGLLG
jgi:Tol biopolymer transport system component